MKLTRYFFTILAVFCTTQLYSQIETKPIEQVRDSLIHEISIANTDTSKLKLICALIKLAPKEGISVIYGQGKALTPRLEDDKWRWNLEMAKGLSLIYNGEMNEASEHFNSLLKESNTTNNAVMTGSILLALSEIYQSKGDMDLALNTIQEARIIFDSLGIKDKSAFAHYNLSLIFRKTGKPDLALKSLAQGLALITPEKQPTLYLNIYNNLGRINRGLAKYDTAQLYYQKALDFALKHNIASKFSGLYNNLGNIAHTRGNLEEALEYYFQSLKIKETNGNNKGISIAYHNMGAVKIDLKLYNDAKIDFEKSLSLGKEVEHKIIIIHNYIKLGIIARELGDLEQAISYHKQSLNLSSEMDYKSGSCESYFNQGENYLKKGSYTEALNSFLEAKTIAEKIGKKDLIGSALTGIANTYLLNSESSNPEFQKILASNKVVNIEKYLLESAQIAQEIGNLSNVETSLSALRSFYKKNNQFKKEAEVANTYIIFRDSIFNKQSADAISQWQTKYETSEKEKEITILQKENELQEIKAKTNRNLYLGGTLLLLLISGLVYTRIFYKNKVERAKQVETLRTKISADLHDDVGSLLTGLAMQTEILQYSIPQADQNKLSRINELSRSAMSRMRDAVWAMNAQNDNWNSLIDRMNEFASEMLSTKDIGFSIKKHGLDSSQNLQGDLRQNIYLIFKETITNILKHSDATFTAISIADNKTSFVMNIKDNGSLKEKEYKTTGQGTNNMQARAKKINGQLSAQFNDGFEVNLIIPK